MSAISTTYSDRPVKTFTSMNRIASKLAGLSSDEFSLQPNLEEDSQVHPGN